MEEQEKSTEQLILEAAAREFAAKGFDGARTAAIAAEAGVTHAMLHYYYRTKEKLFERIFKEKVENIVNMVMAPMVNSEGSILQRVETAVGMHFDYIMNNRELPMFFVTTLNTRPELYSELMEAMRMGAAERKGKLQAELDAASLFGEICPVDAAALMADIASLNLMPFLVAPIMMAMLGYGKDEESRFFADRKRENINTILRRMTWSEY